MPGLQVQQLRRRSNAVVERRNGSAAGACRIVLCCTPLPDAQGRNREWRIGVLIVNVLREGRAGSINLLRRGSIYTAADAAAAAAGLHKVCQVTEERVCKSSSCSICCLEARHISRQRIRTWNRSTCGPSLSTLLTPYARLLGCSHRAQRTCEHCDQVCFLPEVELCGIERESWQAIFGRQDATGGKMRGNREETTNPITQSCSSLTSSATDSTVPLHFQFPPIRYLRAMVVLGVVDWMERLFTSVCVCDWERVFVLVRQFVEIINFGAIHASRTFSRAMWIPSLRGSLRKLHPTQQ